MDNTKTPSTAQDLKQVLGRALVIAHLITGDPAHAEQAVLKAIDRWNPDEDPEEQLVRNVIDAAAQMDPSSATPEPVADELCLPDELKVVLRLDPRLRTCFVVRNLAGMPSRVCARLLRLLPEEVDECNVSALRRLALS